jgi:ACS family tartrate transporter-like MFS transporter
MSFYMPQAIKSLSGVYSNTTVGILVMVPYIAGLVAMILVARSSDASLERRYHAAVPAIIGGIALMSLGASNSPMLSIILWSFTAIGICSYWGPFWSMPSQFLAGYSAASGIALINSIAALGGFIGPSVVGAAATGTRGIYGGLALGGGVCLMASAALILMLPIAVARANHPSRGRNRLAQSNRRS